MTQNPNPDPQFESRIEVRMEAEETLRLLAKLPPPENLNDRVHARVRHQIALESMTPRRRGFWSLWSPGKRLQFAGAAVLAVAVASSMWTIHRAHETGTNSGAGQPVGPQVVAPSQPDAGSDSGFSGAKASRVPATLNPIKVPPAPKKKPSPKGAAKPKTAQPSGPITRAVAAQPESETNR